MLNTSVSLTETFLSLLILLYDTASIKGRVKEKNKKNINVPKFVGNPVVHFSNNQLRLSLYQLPAG